MDFQQPPPSIDVTQPPPQLTAPSALATNTTSIPQTAGPPHHRNYFHQHHGGTNKPGHAYFKPFAPKPYGMTQDDFDGKRLRKSVMRKTVDYNASIVRALETRLWQRDYRDRHAMEPENIYIPELMPPSSYLDNPSNAVTTRFVKTATNKMRCPIFTLAWTPEGRRLVTGASSGEFTLWNGLTFNFETILQAHDVSVRTMIWSHNDSWMVTGDHSGYVKYWQSNMNNVKMFQAHKEAIRGISFSPNDSKFVSCSDDGTLRIWDFLRCQEERILRGHGADVKCVHWHPQKGLIVSGSKDNQQPIKLWDPKSGSALATLHAHKSTVMDLKWNDNGNWLVTASRDHLLKLFDLRNLREEVQIFRGHKREASSVSWHPTHEGLFCSGGSDGSILFWNVGTDKEIGSIETAHDSIVWTLAWHPLGHILCSGSNDHTIKFWTRNRPGDLMRDKYNLNTLPASLAALDDCEYDDAVIPGMGPEDKVEFTESLTADKGFIPGLDLDPSKISDKDKEKKVPYSKPIPHNFQAQWAGTRRQDETGNIHDELAAREIKDTSGLSPEQVSENVIEGMLASGVLTSIDPQAIVGILVYNRFIRVHPDSRLMIAVRQGPEYLNKYLDAGKVDELRDVISPPDRSRSNSPTLEGRESSPPIKKSRFDSTRQHNPQVVYARELLSLKKPFMPCLLSFKSQLIKTENIEEFENPTNSFPKHPPFPQHNQPFPQQPFQQPQQVTPNRPSPWAAGFAPSPGPWGPGNVSNQNGFNNNNNMGMGQNSNTFNSNMGSNMNSSGPNQNGYNNNNSNMSPFNGQPFGGNGNDYGGNFGDNDNNYGDRDFHKNGSMASPGNNNMHNKNNMNNNNMRRSNIRRGVGGGGSRNRGRNTNRRF
ncbi:pre-mRNA 3' end processing protein WDR33 [Teleopsis dalmanni]|uniref:pre-mRNA 3' end processing protein WDR33 n=1 Tax=Teleopsis dalmanni TaxID=139649 RepID=UPI0018CEBE0B|nr:pre-mRNA 3' end processing protein WDR33 [Teleopsis dalmanni]